MNASCLRDCLTFLGADPSFHQIQYIETSYGNEEYLTKVCQSIHSELKYDKVRTEQLPDICPAGEDAYMYPSTCKDGWLDCDKFNGCGLYNYAGVYCYGMFYFEFEIKVLFEMIVKRIYYNI